MSLFSKFLKPKEKSLNRVTGVSLVYNYDEQYIYFKIDGVLETVVSEDWLLNPPTNLDAWSENRRMILSQLAEQGIAETVGELVRIEHTDLYRSPREDIVSLDLADSYRMGIQIKAKGILHEPSFKYSIEYVDAGGRNIVGIKQVGCFLEYGKDQRYLLSESQFRLLTEINRFNSRSPGEKEYADNLLHFADIKGFALDVGAKLDKYLNGEQVVAAKEVTIEIKYIDEDTIEVIPVVEGVSKEAFTSVVDKFQQVQNVYDLPLPDSGRLRVVAGEKAVKGIKEIKRIRHLKGRAKKSFIERPQDFIDPEVIDLDNYSQRVIEIGEYKPRFFPFINPAKKNEWLPEMDFEEYNSSKNQEEKHTPVRTIADLESLEATFIAAKENGEPEFSWGGHVLPVNEETEEHIKRLRDTFETKENNDEVKDGNESTGEENKGNKKILLIEENIEELNYSEGQTVASFIKSPSLMPDNLLPGTSLLDHQQEGLSWLQSLYKTELRGGLLADDMGLGKTLQILTFVSWYIGLGRKKPILVVAPVALLENWAEEYTKFFYSTAELLQLHGDRLSKLRVKKEWSGREYEGEPRISLKTDTISKYDIVLTTYEAVRDYQFSMGKIDWGIVITDESQKIKTPGTLVTTALKALKADFRVACTATPVENNLVDLWCILDFANPGIIGSLKDFLNKYEYPLRKQTTEREQLVIQLRNDIEPHFLRRVKKDILHNLPSKNEVSVTVPLSDSQLEQYMAVVNAYKELDEEHRKGAMLKVLQQLRDISAFPDASENIILDLSLEDIFKSCSKIYKMIELLDTIKKKGEKVIIFTEHRRIQRILSSVIHRRYGISPSIVNGEVAGSSKSVRSSRPTRKRMVDDFQRKLGFNVIIMSPQAAGFGLNIVEANHVIHYTRLWNPAKEDQATDRVYRIGQIKPVYVYYLVSVDPRQRFTSFDQRLDELLSKKRTLASDFLYPSEFIEAKKDEFTNIFEIEREQDKRTLSIEDLDKLKPLLFEAAVATLFEQQGHDTYLTPGTGDYGVDVVCLPRSSEEKGLLIQCKHSTRESAGVDGVGEISSAVSLYEDKYLTRFEPVVVTNNSFSKQAEIKARSNHVKLINRSILKDILKGSQLTLDKIYKKEEDRMKRI